MAETKINAAQQAMKQELDRFENQFAGPDILSVSGSDDESRSNGGSPGPRRAFNDAEFLVPDLTLSEIDRQEAEVELLRQGRGEKRKMPDRNGRQRARNRRKARKLQFERKVDMDEDGSEDASADGSNDELPAPPTIPTWLDLMLSQITLKMQKRRSHLIHYGGRIPEVEPELVAPRGSRLLRSFLAVKHKLSVECGGAFLAAINIVTTANPAFATVTSLERLAEDPAHMEQFTNILYSRWLLSVYEASTKWPRKEMPMRLASIMRVATNYFKRLKTF